MNIRRTKGFTLMELITVIVITGIIAGMVAIFIQSPVQGYISSSNRAALSDMADTAVRRIGRDLRTAVPNSVRMASPSGSTYVEFLPTRDGGMYLALPSGTTVCGGTSAQDILDFTYADSCFAILGSTLTMTGPPSSTPDYIVLGSIESPPASPTATPAYDTSASGILRAYTGATGAGQTAIHFTATQFPLWAQVQGQRLQVIPGDQQAVTYACIGTLGALDANGNGQAQLIRYWAYGFNPTQAAPPMGGGLNAILVNNISACNIVSSTDYQNNSLIAITLQLTQGSESVQLYDEIHVTNIP